MNVLIYGAGGTGRRIFKAIKNNYNVVAFIDSNLNIQGRYIDDVPIIGKEKINKYNFEKIIVGAASGYSEIVDQLLRQGVAEEKIDTSYVKGRVSARECFLKRYSEICSFKNNSKIAVAEGGVFRGEFAKEINRLFPYNKLYLYDTFEGFSDKDVTKDELKSDVIKQREEMVGHFMATSEDLVISRMVHPENCIIRKGWFPSSFTEHNIKFGFVSLDMDLYAPMKAGLECFYKIMIPGGIILVDDFFTPGHPLVQNAVNDFEKDNNLKLSIVPIGDDVGAAIIKPYL